MNGTDLPVPASLAARRLTSFCLLAITALVFQLVLRFNLEAQALPAHAGGDLAQIKTHGFAVVLGVMAMLNIAWFGALIRVQAMEAHMKARAVAKNRQSVTEPR
jgi:hypothetical protein